MNNTTLSNNMADSNNDGSGGGGGIYRAGGGGTFANIIIADNLDTPNNGGPGAINPDCLWANAGTLTTYGYNLIGRGDGCTAFVNGANGDKVGSNVIPRMRGWGRWPMMAARLRRTHCCPAAQPTTPGIPRHPVRLSSARVPALTSAVWHAPSARNATSARLNRQLFCNYSCR